MSFAETFGNKYVKRLMDTATKTGMDATKIASKRVVQKTAETTGDLIGNEIADKITSTGKPKEKEKEKEKPKEMEKIYIPPENKLLMILDCFECNFIECNFIENKICLLLYKNRISKNCKFY